MGRHNYMCIDDLYRYSTLVDDPYRSFGWSGKGRTVARFVFDDLYQCNGRVQVLDVIIFIIL